MNGNPDSAKILSDVVSPNELGDEAESIDRGRLNNRKTVNGECRMSDDIRLNVSHLVRRSAGNKPFTLSCRAGLAQQPGGEAKHPRDLWATTSANPTSAPILGAGGLQDAQYRPHRQ